MGRPWRRYVLSLSLRLHTPVNQLLDQMDAADVAEYIAFDMTQSEDWQAKHKQQQELACSRAMTVDEKDAAFMAAMRGI